MLWKSIRPPKIPQSCECCHIRQRTLCGALDDGQLHIVRKYKKGDRVLPAGAYLYRPGEQCGETYSLLDGWVALYRILPSGRRQILDFVLPGQFFGYHPDAERTMPHGAECLTDVSVCVFPRRGFVGLLRNYPEIGRALNTLLAKDVGRAHDHLTNVGARTASERIANLLLELCARVLQQAPDSRSCVVDIPLTQHDLADALGLSSVYVSQTLKALREKRLLVFRSGRLEIFDRAVLANLADFDCLAGS